MAIEIRTEVKNLFIFYDITLIMKTTKILPSYLSKENSMVVTVTLGFIIISV